MRLFHCKFDPVTYQQSIDWAAEHFRNRRRGYITTVNVSILMTLQSNQRLKTFVENSALTVADGQPIVWLSKLLNRPLPERVTGVDLVPGLCQAATDAGRSVYFLGSKPDVVNDVAVLMKQQIPGLDVAGVQDGYFEQDQSQHIAQQVKDSGAALLIVGLGAPKQEAFLEEHWDQLGVDLAIPIGGAFDMLTDRKPRAAKWIQNIGCEWLWRLYLEPRRLAKRYATTNTRFLYLAMMELLFTKPNRTLLDN